MDLIRDIDLCTLDLKSRAQKLVGELRDYRDRVRQLGRTPVLRLKRDDYLYMRETAKKLAKVDKFDRLLLDGELVQ